MEIWKPVPGQEGRYEVSSHGNVRILHCDFETYSAADLPVCGLDNYASDPTTDVHCAAYAFDDEPVELWVNGKPCPPRVRKHIQDGGVVLAHNASFELAVTNKVLATKHGWPLLSPKQMRCTMAQAYAMSLPGSLEKAAAALGIPHQKDMAGSRIMMQLAKPKIDGGFWTPEEAPEKFQRLYDYCKQDVEVERALDHRMMQLSEQEQRVWVLDQIINQRGIKVDLRSIENAIGMVEAEKARLDAAMLRATGGVVGKCTEVQLLIKWIKAQGVDLPGLAKADVIDALKINDMPSAVRKVLLLRQEAAKSSTAKLTAMKNRASSDGRVRGAMQYHGAHTGRWAHRGIQPGNFPRTRKGIKPKHVGDIIEHLHDRDYIDILYGPVMDALADSLRGMIVASPGHALISADYSNIEGRVLAWLAGEQWKLQAFEKYDAGTGPDLYKVAYSKSFGVAVEEVDDEQRQVGKCQELSMGFQGGRGAFQNIARIYGVKVSDEEADLFKTRWREAHPKIVRYWYEHERAVIQAVEYGVAAKVGPENSQVVYKKAGSFLWCRLPSGRVLCYPYPSVKDIETPWGERKPALHYWRVNPVTNKWEETTTYGGDLAQSATQGTARDVMAYAMPLLEDAGFPIIFTVHDQIVVEVKQDLGETAVAAVEAIMSEPPEWAAGLPLSAEGWRAFRYRK